MGTFLTKLQPLLKLYGADTTDPITGPYLANHTGLDGMFDNVQFLVANGMLTITNAKTTALILTGNVADIASAQMNIDAMTNPGQIPTAPTGLTGIGGANQVTISWSAVTSATSYNLYRSTTSGVTTATGTKIAGVTSPYVLSLIHI